MTYLLTYLLPYLLTTTPTRTTEPANQQQTEAVQPPACLCAYVHAASERVITCE